MNDITVVVPTSPIRSHPSTEMIEQTISDIRVHLPTSEILILIDGVRKEQEYLREQYEEYTSKLMFLALHEWDNVLPILFEEHKHQSGMMHEAMSYINTPLLLYVEHDTPLVADKKIDWNEVRDMIYTGKAHTIRFHFENVIPDEHKKLMLGKKGNFMRTYQWSQRPHLSTVLYYKDVMTHFPKTARTMIEDLYHGVVWRDFTENGMLGWHKHKLWIYYPKNGIQRSYNLDGRKDEDKYEMKFE